MSLKRGWFAVSLAGIALLLAAPAVQASPASDFTFLAALAQAAPGGDAVVPAPRQWDTAGCVIDCATWISDCQALGGDTWTCTADPGDAWCKGPRSSSASSISCPSPCKKVIGLSPTRVAVNCS